jgi:hypothetical protein
VAFLLGVIVAGAFGVWVGGFSVRSGRGVEASLNVLVGVVVGCGGLWGSLMCRVRRGR